MSDVNVKGLSELQKFLDQVPAKIERNVMRGALRAGMKVVLPVAKGNIHSVSGDLAAGLRIGTRSRGGVVSSYIRTKGRHGFVAHWVEFGTAAHGILGKFGGSMFFGGIFTKSVDHPGARPHPFMRPALDSQAQPAVVAAAEYMKNRLATKEGLDTSAVLIEGDA